MSTIEKALQKLGGQTEGSHSDQNRAGDENPVVPDSGIGDSAQVENDSNGAAGALEVSGGPGFGPTFHVDSDRLEAAGFLVPDRWTADMTESYRRIKRPLIANAFGIEAIKVDRGNLILVTSSLSGEGKTFTALNLALSIAMERDYTVMLVDCDCSKAGISYLLGLDQQPGLIDILNDPSKSVSDVLVKTDITNLRIVPAGRQHKYATELLGSNRMRDLVAEIESRYPDRIVILDSPPVLQSADTPLLASMVGQIAYIVDALNTPQGVVREALSSLDPDKVIGMILNKSHNAEQDGYNVYYRRDY